MNTEIPDDWETDRDDEFQSYTDGLVKAYDGTIHPNPDTNLVIRFSNTVQYIRYVHYKTGVSVDELWEKYDSQIDEQDT